MPRKLAPRIAHHASGRQSLSRIVEFCDRLLRIREVNDYDGALNGLQVQNTGVVNRVAAAVDATLATAKLAVQSRANLLIVHHGLFWSIRQPWTGANYELMRFLLENNLAVYSAHLPLDLHPKIGNNVLLCRALGFKSLQPFFFDKSQYLGFQATTTISRTALARRLENVVGGRVTLLPGGSETCRRIGVVTGGAGSQLKAAKGVDTFITGEGPHWTHALAEELRLNVFYAGHYATETFGVKALAAEISKRFQIPWQFVDYPTGL
jgi:dinuclear metal center YbgI/SA1388 family protein